MTPENMLHPKGTERGESADMDHLEAARVKDDVFFVLSNYRRRFILEYCRGRDEPIGLRELSEALAAYENGIDKGLTTAPQRKRAYVSLRQTHLPKLDELGILEFDQRRGEILPGSDLSELEPYLAPRAEPTRVSRGVVIGLVLAMTMILGVAVLGIGIV